MTLQRGDFVEFDGLLAVVVGLAGEADVPDDHVALWFGDPPPQRKSEGAGGAAVPEVWTVPQDYCEPAPMPMFKH